MPQYKGGDQVRYKPVGGNRIGHASPDSRPPESVGTVKGVLMEPGNQAGRNMSASAEQPQYEVRDLGQDYLELKYGPWALALPNYLKIENANTSKTTTIYEANILGSV
ncbi:hypothetical protein MYCTH_2111820 [Thermothelomyces thermophilus ATCC 42464]|uniref:Hypervirulence associated protein TUDOR domain-containing protein n=1 Tax=Thermothelomyces thermophilus (strain ATCC 42464 / BCRC 31852 / DSM 1799) TaxID=573729 RepID=G2QJA8_THET4|nr:uncharacterized protein MYCTH_2111820 [Thermothelomyces thermophilus ATCC 42464]AEO59665.1 hypothetical protein MYCTH_2111820 [Thermothelomyces thermophilus ATCC 42464]